MPLLSQRSPTRGRVFMAGGAHALPERLSQPARPICHMYNTGNGAQRAVILCEGIPDTLSVLAAGLRDTGACGLYGTGGLEPAWPPLFRHAGREPHEAHARLSIPKARGSCLFGMERVGRH